MLDAKKILDQFLGAGAGGSGRPGGGGLADMVGGALSRMGGPGAPQRQEPRYDDRYEPRNAPAPRPSGNPLDSLTQGGLGGGLGGMAGGAIAGTLASILMGKGKKSLPISNSALKLGGLAILGGLAYKAWQNYQQSQQAPAAPQPQAGPVQVSPPPQQTTFSPSSPAEEEHVGELLVRAMIAAARADGHIDGAEMGKIREALKATGFEGDEQAFLIDSLSRSDDLDALARDAKRSGAELASEVWLAARLSIDPDSPAEQAFLRDFAQKLGLDAGLVAHLEATAAQARRSGVEAV